MIFGGLAAGGESSVKRKAYLRSIHNVEVKPKKPRSSLLITFLENNLEGIHIPHNDPVVVSAVIANF